jgi:molecular chaperone GrpE
MSQEKAKEQAKEQAERMEKDAAKGDVIEEIESALKALKPEHAQKKEPTLNIVQDSKAQDPKDAKIAELTDLLQHVQADFENYKKRSEKESHNHSLTAKAQVIKRLLPVLDTFDHALKDHKDHSDHKGECDGLKRVYDQLFSALESEGLRPIKAVGEKLDPYRHECLEEDCSPHPKNMIIDEIQKGYMLGEYVLRHSLVKVSSGKTAEKKAEAPGPIKKGENEVDK